MYKVGDLVEVINTESISAIAETLESSFRKNIKVGEIYKVIGIADNYMGSEALIEINVKGPYGFGIWYYPQHFKRFSINEIL